MHPVRTLIRPRWQSIRNTFRKRGGRFPLLKLGLFGGVGLLFWSGIFMVSFRVLTYFKNTEEIGHFLSLKLLSMALATFFALLVFSGILTALGKLYLSRDLLLAHSLPVSARTLFAARWLESLFDSSWMVILYALPVFVAFGIVHQAGPGFYGLVGAGFLLLAVIASCLSTLLVMLAVIVVPASRMRSICFFLGLALFLAFYLAVRLLKPERLVDPEAFTSALAYLDALKTPSSPWLPFTWVFDALQGALSGAWGSAVFNLSLAGCGAFALIYLMVAAAGRFYPRGFTKSQEASAMLLRRRRRHPPLGLARLSPLVRALALKDLRTFFRDQTQWSQLLLIGALIIIYLYNFKVLPLERSPIATVYLQNLLSFLNMALAALVLIAVTARFAFPAVSIEKEAFWLIQAGPVSLRTFLRIKFFLYLLPLLLLAEILIIATNLLLQVSLLMMVLSSATMALMVPGVVALGIGLGAAYPDFKAENPAQAVTSFGGLVFMAGSVLLVGAIILLEAGPVYHLIMAQIRGEPLDIRDWIWIIGSFGLVILLGLLAIVIPLRFGERRLGIT